MEEDDDYDEEEIKRKGGDRKRRKRGGFILDDVHMSYCNGFSGRQVGVETSHFCRAKYILIQSLENLSD